LLRAFGGEEISPPFAHRKLCSRAEEGADERKEAAYGGWGCREARYQHCAHKLVEGVLEVELPEGKGREALHGCPQSEGQLLR
jgi:hypothetical protein